MRFALYVAVLLAIPYPASAQDLPNAVVAPSSKWVLDYGADRCRILRTFGEGEAKTLVFFEQVEPEANLTWMVAGPVVSSLRVGDKTMVQFGPSLAPFEVMQRGVKFGDYGEALTSTGFRDLSQETSKAKDHKTMQRLAEDFATRPRALDPAEGAAVEWMEIQSERVGTVRFALGDLKPVYEAMNACMANLLTHWGLDPARELERVKGPVPKNMKALANKLQSQYPSDALRSGQQGVIGARVMIDAEGRIGDCTINELTQAEKFGAGVCRNIVSTARFEPALDADGNPMPSYYFVAIRYAIPN